VRLADNSESQSCARTLLALELVASVIMTIDGYPILEKLLAQGIALCAVTQDWMKKWRGMDLDSAEYEFKELSGSTSINMKIRKPKHPKDAAPGSKPARS